MPIILTDSTGKELSRFQAEELAYYNIRVSLGTRELIESYMENLSDNELLEWATDENGEFSQ